MTTTRWPLRVRFAHWVLHLISPWLRQTPEDVFDEWDEDATPVECRHGVRREMDCGLCDLGNGFEL